MVKYEYKIVSMGGLFSNKNPVNVEKKLNELGKEGWELVSVNWTTNCYYFKRKK